MVDRNKMAYKGTNKTYDYGDFKTIRAFGNEIRNNIINLDTANIEQANLLSYIYNFTKKKQNHGILNKENWELMY